MIHLYVAVHIACQRLCNSHENLPVFIVSIRKHVSPRRDRDFVLKNMGKSTMQRCNSRIDHVIIAIFMNSFFFQLFQIHWISHLSLFLRFIFHQ